MPAPINFPGYPHFLQLAANDARMTPAAVRVARQQPAVNQIASLVCQYKQGSEIHPDSLRALCELRDGLTIAAESAKGMIAWLEPPVEVKKVAK